MEFVSLNTIVARVAGLYARPCARGGLWSRQKCAVGISSW